MFQPRRSAIAGEVARLSLELPPSTFESEEVTAFAVAHAWSCGSGREFGSPGADDAANYGCVRCMHQEPRQWKKHLSPMMSEQRGPVIGLAGGDGLSYAATQTHAELSIFEGQPLGPKLRIIEVDDAKLMAPSSHNRQRGQRYQTAANWPNRVQL